VIHCRTAARRQTSRLLIGKQVQEAGSTVGHATYKHDCTLDCTVLIVRFGSSGTWVTVWGLCVPDSYHISLVSQTHFPPQHRLPTGDECGDETTATYRESSTYHYRSPSCCRRRRWICTGYVAARDYAPYVRYCSWLPGRGRETLRLTALLDFPAATCHTITSFDGECEFLLLARLLLLPFSASSSSSSSCSSLT
jgi:hypothetical protein